MQENNTFQFELIKTKGAARAGIISTPHGKVETPIFMPVGTLASVKALDMQDVEMTQAQIQLANTYHLYLRPGEKIVAQAGGLHRFSGWKKPILTDSGGFQVWSLAQNRREWGKLAKVDENGVEFKSHLDGSKHFFTPEKAIQIQQDLGADIIMAFDEAMSDTISLEEGRASLTRTARWAERSLKTWEDRGRRSSQNNYQALFGIIQGAKHRELREAAAAYITSLPFDGIALGGETIGYNMPASIEVMGWLEPTLPKNKPRYAMGLGREPQDIIDAVLAGFDMFDCVGPTRLARNGALFIGEVDFSASTPQFRSFSGQTRINIGRSEFATQFEPISTHCDCHTCSNGYSLAYLHHLYKTQELSYYRLASIHNVRTMIRTASQLRNWILGD